MRRMLLTLTLLLAGAGAAGAQELRTQELRIPMAAAGPEGLEALLVEPDTPGRHPLVLISHGSPREASKRPETRTRGLLAQAEDFARRGFVAVIVLRRGYGTSPGGWAEGYGPCDDPNYLNAGRAGAEDLRAAIAFLARRPDVDPQKIVAVGVSAGGFATVALTAEAPPGLVAAISFAGGRGSHGPDDVCHDERLVEAFRVFGETSGVPMLWVYAENDHFFDPSLAKRLDEAFTSSGGKVTFVRASPFGDEGHHLFSPAGRTIWLPIVDRFLAAHDLGEVPHPVTQLKPPRQLRASAMKDFQSFLDAAPHKAFAVSDGGAYAWRTARDTTEEASADALRKCRDAAHGDCRLYAVDDEYAK